MRGRVSIGVSFSIIAFTVLASFRVVLENLPDLVEKLGWRIEDAAAEVAAEEAIGENLGDLGWKMEEEEAAAAEGGGEEAEMRVGVSIFS